MDSYGEEGVVAFDAKSGSRVVGNQHGILVTTEVVGEIGQFSFTQLLWVLTASLTLLFLSDEMADVVALYLSETGNAQLLPLLCQHLRPSARVVSNVWEMPVPPSRTLHAKGSNVPLHLFERAALMGQA